MEPVGVAVVGAGYWGPNLVRNLGSFEGTTVRWVCDIDIDKARQAAKQAGARATDSLDDLLSDPGVEAVAIATPAATHVDVALACLESGRHVLVEKPLAMSVADGEKILTLAATGDRVLMCDHTYCYTPAVRKIRDWIRSGTLGNVQYVDSVRINLGLVQHDVDVFWDLASHDLSILDFILPEECRPEAVSAHGADPLGSGQSCVGFLTMPLAQGGIAHVNVNWLSPTKVRRTIIGGSERIVLWDDLDPAQRLSMYDKGVDLQTPIEGEERRRALISYRVGDMVAPALPEVEALELVVREFAAAVRERRPALTDGFAGVRVLGILEAASRSLDMGGESVQLGPAG
jgi:predicted dehydrogenase